MYRSITDFLNDWRYESHSTMKCLNMLTDASLAQSVSPEGRTLGQLAWHIAETLAEMPTRAGLTVTGADTGAEENSIPPTSAATIASTYEGSAKQVTEQVQAHWTDASLTDEVEMYGRKWTKGTVLSVLIKHQAHHRGQLTILMRQAGLLVPGMYGPSKEEWATIGVPSPK